MHISWWCGSGGPVEEQGSLGVCVRERSVVPWKKSEDQELPTQNNVILCGGTSCGLHEINKRRAERNKTPSFNNN